MMIKKEEIKIFYSWQSDLPDATNKAVIRTSIRKAVIKIEEKYINEQIIIDLDEATKRVAGSPNIPVTIMDKIEKSDIFIADVSIINTNSEDLRKCPNPNVVFELGFAVSHLGWNRIIMLFNSNHGSLDNLPFDFDRHRASGYKIKDKDDKQGKNSLITLLIDAIDLIIIENPKRPIDEKEISPEKQKRQKDISKIQWILSSIHIPSIDLHIKQSPYMIENKIFHFWESYNGIITNSLFYLYDKCLEKYFKSFHSVWKTSIAYGQYYDQNSSGNYIFKTIHNDNEQEIAIDKMQKANEAMLYFLSNILRHIRENYLEIDIDECNQCAWHDYIEYYKT